MKLLFWLFAGLSIAAGLLISFSSLFWRGLGLIGTPFGEVMYYVALVSIGVSIVGVILGIFSLRKNAGKRALVFALLGLLYSGIALVGMGIDDIAKRVIRDQNFDRYMEEIYGKGWDSPSAIEGLPESYETLLNKFYVAVRDRWPAEELTELGAVAMVDYYGEESLDNIGFVLMDVNGDDIDELVVGTAGSAEGEATVMFCLYSNLLYPTYDISSLDGEIHYLHSGQGSGTYEAEFVGSDLIWVLEPAVKGGIFHYTERRGTLDPAGRLALEMIPFSQYK